VEAARAIGAISSFDAQVTIAQVATRVPVSVR
jgi:hypothetical protein